MHDESPNLAIGEVEDFHSIVIETQATVGVLQVLAIGIAKISPDKGQVSNLIVAYSDEHRQPIRERPSDDFTLGQGYSVSREFVGERTGVARTIRAVGRKHDHDCFVSQRCLICVIRHFPFPFR